MGTPTFDVQYIGPLQPAVAPHCFTPRLRLAAMGAALLSLTPAGCGTAGQDTVATGGAAVPVPVAGQGANPPAPPPAAPAAPVSGGAQAPVVPATLQPAAAPVPAPITLGDPWVRAAAATRDAGGAPNANSAAYMVIKNAGPRADTLTGAAGDAADTVEIHRTSMDGGVMRMRPAGDVDIPAGGQVTLEPGGLHVMFIGLRRDLADGDAVTFALRFARAGEVRVSAPVRRQGMPGM